MTEEQVFLAALDLPDAAARAAYLDETCGKDGEFRHQVDALLAAHFKSGEFLDVPAADQVQAGPKNYNTVSIAGDAVSAEKGREDEADDLKFLAPPTREGALGRLGHYEVLQVLGRGGFGIVFRAFDEVLQRVVALKVMAPQLAATSPARKRFLREARSSAQVRHENVVQVYEVAERPLPYLAMEFIPGETLQQRLDRVGPLEVPEVLRIGRQIAEGLAAAHAMDLIHRDIKPGNVLLEGGHHKVKISDFGLARAADDASISQSGIIAGTPMYMAPEQAQGQTLDQRADLFSLGSVLYQMVAGRPPFRANTTVAVLKRVAEDKPRAIREIIPETPQWLCDIIAKLHAKGPADRYQSAREVADVLADCEAQLKANSKLKDFSRIPRSKQPAAGNSGRWKWIAAAVLLLPVLALTLTETTGLTHLIWSHQPQASPEPLVKTQLPQPAPLSPATANAPFDAKKARAHQEAWAKYLGVPLEYENSLGMKFILIPPGEFLMGVDPEDVDLVKLKLEGEPLQLFRGRMSSASPRHKVRITRAFYMQTHEVKIGWYQKVMGKLPPDHDPNRPDAPVAGYVAWADAIAFCDALSKLEGKTPAHRVAGAKTTRVPSAHGYRLPTEAEWEYACRAGTTTLWFFGDDPNGSTGSKGAVLLQYENGKKANPFGLFDVYAGSTEWCWDRFVPYGPDAVVDPVAEPDGTVQVCRGGSNSSGSGRDFEDINSIARFTHDSRDGVPKWDGLGRVVLPIEAVKAAVVPARSVRTDSGAKDKPASPALAPFTDADVQRIAALPGTGGRLARLELEPDLAAAREPREDLLALDRLAAADPLKAELVKLRYFVGLTLPEAAAALGLSERTAGRHWAYARAWLRRAVEGTGEKS